MSNLYELSANFRALAEQMEESELPPEVISDTLDAESGDLQDKVINVAKFLKNLEASAKSRRDAAKEMIDRAASEEKRADSLKRYLLSNMELANLPKVSSPWFVVSVKTNPPSTIIDDESLLPADYVREIPASTAPDKTLIKKAIQDGFTVPGAHLESTKTVSIK